MEHWIYSIYIAGHSAAFNLDTLITMWLTMLILIILALCTTKNISIIPGKLQVVGESIINYFVDTAKANMSEKEALKHSPIILTLFFFIITANLVGQLPWHLLHLHQGELASPNNDINMTAAMAIVVSVYYMYYGARRKGMKFFFHGFSMEGIILTLVDWLEFFIRPLTLAVRLFANILAGELLIFTFVSLCAYVLPIPFMLFEILVAIVQAMVFTLLSTIYIATAVEETH